MEVLLWDAQKVSLARKVPLAPLPRDTEDGRDASQKLDHLREMVVLLLVSGALLRLKEEVAGEELEDGACNAPHVRGARPVAPEHYLGAERILFLLFQRNE